MDNKIFAYSLIGLFLSLAIVCFLGANDLKECEKTMSRNTCNHLINR